MSDPLATSRRRNGTSPWHHNGSNGFLLAASDHASINRNAEGNRHVALHSDYTRSDHSSFHGECEDDAHSCSNGNAIFLGTIEYTGIDEDGDKSSENESTRRSQSRRSLSIKNKDLDVDDDDDSAADSDSEGGISESIRIATMEEASSEEENDSEGEVQQESRPPPRSTTKSLRDTSENSIPSSISSAAVFSENGESSGIIFNREESLRISTMEDIANWDEHNSEEEEIELRKSCRRSLSAACSDCGDSSSHLNGEDSKELSWMESHWSSHTSATTDADENEKHDVLTPMVATLAGNSRFRRRSSSLEELMLSQNLSFEPLVSTQASAYGFDPSITPSSIGRDSSCKTVDSETSATLEDLMMPSPLRKASANKAANDDSQQSMNDIFHDTIQWEGSFNFTPSPQDKLPTISAHTPTTASPASKSDNGSSGADSDGAEEVECLPDDGSKTIRFASKALIIGNGESVTTCDVSTKGSFYIGKRNNSSSNNNFSVKGITCEDGSNSETLPDDSTKWFESDIWEDVARRDYDDDEHSFISCESEEERLDMWDKKQIANDRLKKSLIWSLGGYAVSSIIAIFARRLTRENIDEEVNDVLVDAAAEGTRRSISSKSGGSYGLEGEAYNGVVDAAAAGETKRRSIDAAYGYGDAAGGETKRRSIDAVYGYGDVASGETKRRSIEAGACGAPEGSESCTAPSNEFFAANAIAAAGMAASVAALASNTSGSAAGGASLATKTKEQSATGGAPMTLAAAAAVAAVSANTQVVQSMAVSAASNAARSGVSGSSAVMGMGSEGRKGTVSALGLTTSIAAAMAVVAIGGATVYTTPQRIEQRAGSPDAGLVASACDCAHENPDMETEKIVFTLDIPIGVDEIDMEGWEEIFAEAYNNLTDFGCDDLFERHIDEGSVILLNATRQTTTGEKNDLLFDSTEDLLETEWNVTVSCWEECPDEAAFGADLGANTRRRNIQESDVDSPVDNDSEEKSNKDDVQEELQNLINKLEFRETFEEALRFHHGLGKRKPGGSANGDGKSDYNGESSSDFPSDFPSDGPSSLPSEDPSVGVGNSDGNGESKSKTPDAESYLTNDAHSAMPSNLPSERPSSLPSIHPSGAGRSSGIDGATPGTSPDEDTSALPSVIPSEEPTNRNGENKPDSTNTRSPTMKPTVDPTKSPTSDPTKTPTKFPTTRPTKSPTVVPSANPTKSPTIMPTVSPSKSSTGIPIASTRPSVSPSELPTFASESPSLSPSELPSSTSSELLSTKPSESPSAIPSRLPTASPPEPSESPSKSSLPSLNPSESPFSTLSEPPSLLPSGSPSEIPSQLPSVIPSESPSQLPSESPSEIPSQLPSVIPLESPSQLPSESPSELPSPLPSHMPSELPSGIPSDPPSKLPSVIPSESPSQLPSGSPSDPPSQLPSVIPSESPSQLPSESPSELPSPLPSHIPSELPSGIPSDPPSQLPSVIPSESPSQLPSESPSGPTTPAPTSNPPDTPEACCSQMFDACVPVPTCTPYTESRCEGLDGSQGCWDGKLRWLHAGPDDNCLVRYTNNCHNKAKPCCSPGECIMFPGYSQCLHWVDDAYGQGTPM